GDDGVVGEQAAEVEVAGGEQKDGVAVDDAAVLVGEEGAVGVAVEGDAHGGFLGDDFGGYDVGVERTAELVDVEAVGAGVSDDDLAAKVGEELRSDRRGGSVGAVDDDALVIEREAGNG